MELALNMDKRRHVIENTPYSVGQHRTKGWALFLEVLICSQIFPPYEKVYSRFVAVVGSLSWLCG